MDHFKHFCYVFGVVALLGACTPGDPVRYRNPQLVADPDKVTAKLAQAADRASLALETLAAVEQTRTPSVASKLAPAADVPVELRRGVSVNWIGPAENITEMLANRASYLFKVTGKAPAAPLVVSLDVENKPIFDVLRSIGLQLGTKADISVDAVTRTVELRYGSVVGMADMF